MDGPVHYPGADRESQWFGDAFPGVTMPRIDKLLLHTTEGSDWPGYKGGKAAPTLTYHPAKHTWRQHFRINQSSRALVDSDFTAVRENRDNVVQVEIVCSCDPAFIKKHDLPDVRDLDDRALRDLGELAAWLHDEWGLPLELTPDWLPFPDSFGKSKVRMTGPQYDAFKGILGHQHAPAGSGKLRPDGTKDLGNVHGDPGALDVQAILQFARAAAGSTRSMSAVAMEEEEDVKPTDVVGFEIDPKTQKKVPITLETFVGRMNWVYQQLIDKGKVDSQLDRIEDAVKHH
jgi:hypothetical protein